MATNTASSVLRRRDKRRHVSSSVIELRDPFEIVGLAVRFDESRQDEALLRAPLEGGRLYDNPQRFSEVLELLQEKTRAPSRISPPKHSPSWRIWVGAAPKIESEEPTFAFTPIILSGLLSAIQEQRESEQVGDSPVDVSSELVMSCQTMRQAALARVRFNKKYNRVQRVVLPFFCVTVLILLYIRAIADTQRVC